MAPTPYHSDEIASAIVEAARRGGVPLRHVVVRADEDAGVWLIQGSGERGEDQRLTLPFASAQGIYTPAEIARHFTRGSWPFG